VVVSSIPTNVKYRDFERTAYKIAESKGYIVHKENKPGSKRHYDVFEFDKDGKPKLRSFWVCHEEKVIYTRDLGKCCDALGITKEEMLKAIEES
jgi:hypothetical protein